MLKTPTNPANGSQRFSSAPKPVGNLFGTGLKRFPIPMIGSESERTSRRLNSAGPSECQSVGPLGRGMYEVRSDLTHNRIARVLFYIDRQGRMVLLHGFMKRTQKTPGEDLALARRNKEKHEGGLQ